MGYHQHFSVFRLATHLGLWILNPLVKKQFLIYSFYKMKKVKKSKSFKIYLQKPLIRGFFRTFPQKRRRCVLYYYLFWLFLIKIKNRETVTMLLPNPPNCGPYMAHTIWQTFCIQMCELKEYDILCTTCNVLSIQY